jgi:hypothetical protein
MQLRVAPHDSLSGVSLNRTSAAAVRAAAEATAAVRAAAEAVVAATEGSEADSEEVRTAAAEAGCERVGASLFNQLCVCVCVSFNRTPTKAWRRSTRLGLWVSLSLCVSLSLAPNALTRCVSFNRTPTKAWRRSTRLGLWVSL